MLQKYSEFATKSDARSNTLENLCNQMWSGSHKHTLHTQTHTQTEIFAINIDHKCTQGNICNYARVKDQHRTEKKV